MKICDDILENLHFIFTMMEVTEHKLLYSILLRCRFYAKLVLILIYISFFKCITLI